jgi:hypothetical protein
MDAGEQGENPDLMPGLDQRPPNGVAVSADDFIASHNTTQDAMAKMKKGVAEGKWNYPPEYTKKANADDEDELKVSLINKDARKAWRKKQKAKAHKDLMTGKKKEPGVAEGAIDNLEARRIEDLNLLMDEILVRFRTEKLPAHYRDALKQRLDQLKAERNSYYHART